MSAWGTAIIEDDQDNYHEIMKIMIMIMGHCNNWLVWYYDDHDQDHDYAALQEGNQIILTLIKMMIMMLRLWCWDYDDKITMIMMTQRSNGDVQIFTWCYHNLPQSLGAQMKSVRSDKSIKRSREISQAGRGVLELEHISVGCIALSGFSLEIQELPIR